MRTTPDSALERRLAVLLRDYGYRWGGEDLIRSGIRGFISDEVLPHRFRTLMDAAEWLCPIVSCAEYTERLVRATSPAPATGRG